MGCQNQQALSDGPSTKVQIQMREMTMHGGGWHRQLPIDDAFRAWWHSCRCATDIDQGFDGKVPMPHLQIRLTTYARSVLLAYGITSVPKTISGRSAIMTTQAYESNESCADDFKTWLSSCGLQKKHDGLSVVKAKRGMQQAQKNLHDCLASVSA